MRKALFVVALLALFAGCAPQRETYRVVFTPGPGQDLAAMQEKYDPTMAYLEERTGYKFEIVTAANYTAAIEDIRAGHSEVMRGGPAAYVMAAKQTEVELLGREIIGGSESYLGMVIAKPGLFKEPYDLADVVGHTMAFVGPESTSGYVAAKVLLNRAGVEIEDLGEIAYMGSHPAVIEAVVSGAVDVGATCDRRVNIAIEEGVAVEGENYVVLAYSPPIVGNPWFIRGDLPGDVKDAIRRALLEVPREVLEPSGADDIIPALDSDYDFTRELIEAAEE